MTIKIISNGKPHCTRIVDAETGADLTSVLRATNIEWRDTGDACEATFVCHGVPLETEGGFVVSQTTQHVHFDRNGVRLGEELPS